MQGQLIAAFPDRVSAERRLSAHQRRALHAYLERQRELWSAFHPSKPFAGVATIEAERDLPTGLVRDVMLECARAGYSDVGFLGVR